jgi:hypothetical protein
MSSWIVVKRKTRVCNFSYPAGKGVRRRVSKTPQSWNFVAGLFLRSCGRGRPLESFYNPPKMRLRVGEYYSYPAGKASTGELLTYPSAK